MSDGAQLRDRAALVVDDVERAPVRREGEATRRTPGGHLRADDAVAEIELRDPALRVEGDEDEAIGRMETPRHAARRQPGCGDVVQRFRSTRTSSLPPMTATYAALPFGDTAMPRGYGPIETRLTSLALARRDHAQVARAPVRRRARTGDRGVTATTFGTDADPIRRVDLQRVSCRCDRRSCGRIRRTACSRRAPSGPNPCPYIE